MMKGDKARASAKHLGPHAASGAGAGACVEAPRGPCSLNPAAAGLPDHITDCGAPANILSATPCLPRRRLPVPPSPARSRASSLCRRRGSATACWSRLLRCVPSSPSMHAIYLQHVFAAHSSIGLPDDSRWLCVPCSAALQAGASCGQGPLPDCPTCLLCLPPRRTPTRQLRLQRWLRRCCRREPRWRRTPSRWGP